MVWGVVWGERRGVWSDQCAVLEGQRVLLLQAKRWVEGGEG